MGILRKTRANTSHRHVSQYEGQTCFICKSPLNRKAKTVAFNDGQTVTVCRPCFDGNNLGEMK